MKWTITIAVIAFASGVSAAPKLAWVNVFDAIKTVNESATLEYHPTNGVPQSVSVQPGVYKISIQKLKR